MSQSLIDTLATAVADPSTTPPPGAVERAIAKASELQAATDKLAVVALHPPGGSPKGEGVDGVPSLPSRPSKPTSPVQDASVLAPLVMNQHMSSEWQVCAVGGCSDTGGALESDHADGYQVSRLTRMQPFVLVATTMVVVCV